MPTRLERAVEVLSQEGFGPLCVKVATTVAGDLRVYWRRARYGLRRQLAGDDSLKYEGITVDTDYEVITESIRRLLVRGKGYESAEIELIRRYIDPDTSTIEFGAGIGIVSCILDRQLDPSTSQIAVEAHPETLPVLESTRDENDARFSIRWAAYTSETEPVAFRPASEFLSSHVVGTRSVSTGDSIKVPGTTVAEIVAGNDLDPVQLVVDIEGAEYEMLASELETLKAVCSLLIVEFHDVDRTDSAECEGLLLANGFELLEKIHSVGAYRNTELQ